MRGAQRWIVVCVAVAAAACAKGGTAADDTGDDAVTDGPPGDDVGDDGADIDAEPHNDYDADTTDAPPTCIPTAELCNGLDDDCDPLTPDGADETWFNQPCDGADVDPCNEGTITCAGSAQSCSDATGDSNVIVDGSFELGPTSPAWAQSSTNFGTPLCNAAGCGLGGGTGPRTGTWWAWFGGTTTAFEVATASQSVIIPVGVATLTFWFEIPSCETGAAGDVFQVRIDGNTVFSATDDDPACGVVGYTQKTVVVSAYATGTAHTVTFTGTTDDFTVATNFMVDDVRLVSCP
jgi:hypothetical protein